MKIKQNRLSKKEATKNRNKNSIIITIVDNIKILACYECNFTETNTRLKCKFLRRHSQYDDVSVKEFPLKKCSGTHSVLDKCIQNSWNK